MLPNFLVIGAGKAGTTSVWAYLRAHPEVFVSDPKELDFFAREGNWWWGLSWYERHFAGAEGYRAVGEVSGSYANWPEYQGVPERIASTIPDARLVYVLRDPVDRMVSGYRFHWVRREETRPMAQAFAERPAYADIGRYATQIDQYLEHFPREQLLLVVSEDLRRDRAAVMRRVFSFLDVDPDVPLDGLEHEYNRTDRKARAARPALRALQRLPGYGTVAKRAPEGMRRFVDRVGKHDVVPPPEPLTDELRSKLRAELLPDVLRLREHLGPDFHCWGWDADEVAARPGGTLAT